MSNESARTIGKAIGMQATDASSTKDNLQGEDARGSVGTLNTEDITVGGTYTGIRFNYSENALVWNHPLYGDLNVYSWNADYLAEISGLEMPITFPIVFNDTLSDGSELLSSGDL